MKISDEISIEDILNSADFLAFHHSMLNYAKVMDASHTMIGFNYKHNEISSVKFYYVFNAVKGGSDSCPIPSLAAEYSAFMRHAAWDRVMARLSAGAGITFAIKFDRYFSNTKGFFFRLDKSNKELVRNVSDIHKSLQLNDDDFYNGYGQYVLENSSIISTSEYLYLRNTHKLSVLESEAGIAFSQAGCVEISASGSCDRSDQKFIGIGTGSLIRKEFLQRIPSSIPNYFKGMEWQFCCPAYAPDKEQSTIYIIGKLKSDVFQCSPIDALVAKVGADL